MNARMYRLDFVVMDDTRRTVTVYARGRDRNEAIARGESDAARKAGTWEGGIVLDTVTEMDPRRNANATPTEMER